MARTLLVNFSFLFPFSTQSLEPPRRVGRPSVRSSPPRYPCDDGFHSPLDFIVISTPQLPFFLYFFCLFLPLLIYNICLGLTAAPPAPSAHSRPIFFFFRTPWLVVPPPPDEPLLTWRARTPFCPPYSFHFLPPQLGVAMLQTDNLIMQPKETNKLSSTQDERLRSRCKKKACRRAYVGVGACVCREEYDAAWATLTLSVGWIVWYW